MKINYLGFKSTQHTFNIKYIIKQGSPTMSITRDLKFQIQLTYMNRLVTPITKCLVDIKSTLYVTNNHHSI
jgi:hypothetical protein